MSKGNFEKIINSEKPVLIDFYADWCGPCKSFAPILQTIKDEIDEKARVIKINVDKNEALSQKLNIRSIPTIQLYQAGELKWEASGVQTKALILKKIEDLLASKA